MRGALRLLGYLWALPNTVIGLVFGLLSFQLPRVTSGILVFDRRVAGVIWIVSRMRRTAVTYGHVVLGAAPVEGQLLAHELHHVRQYERLGPLYIPVYLAIFAVRGYWRHPFEESARRAAGEPTSVPRRGARG